MILKRPLISEKSMDLVKLNMYTFEVAQDASKDEIRKEVTERFKVTVLSVKTMNRKGKTKLQRSRKGYFSTPSSKRALVVLAKGDKIALFEQNKEEKAKVTTAENVTEVKEKKSLLKGTKIKVEKVAKESKESKEKKKKTEKKGTK